MPAWARRRPALPQASGDQRAELDDPAPDRFIRDVQTALGQQFLNIAITEGEPQIEPNRALDHDRGEAMPAIGKRVHSTTLPGAGRSGPVTVTMLKPASA